MFRERKQPLLIGSVKSNVGHTEITAALVSIIKIIVAFRTGQIAPNLHLDDTNLLDKSLEGINDNTLQVIFFILYHCYCYMRLITLLKFCSYLLCIEQFISVILC